MRPTEDVDSYLLATIGPAYRELVAFDDALASRMVIDPSELSGRVRALCTPMVGAEMASEIGAGLDSLLERKYGIRIDNIGGTE